MNRSFLLSGVKRDMFFIILFRGVSVGEAVLLLFSVGPAQGAWGLSVVFMRVFTFDVDVERRTLFISRC